MDMFYRIDITQDSEVGKYYIRLENGNTGVELDFDEVFSIKELHTAILKMVQDHWRLFS